MKKETQRGTTISIKSKVYSHSRLWLFENCPEAFKAKYIDNIFPEMPLSVQLFLGSMTHETLEWLYHAVKTRDVELDDMIEHFANNWKEQWKSDIRMNSDNQEYYFNKGVKFLVDYYLTHKPFNDNTIEIEKHIVFPLDNNGEYKIQGYIDRLVYNNETKEYEVHDYKTNEYMKKQEQVDEDRQLAFYHLGLQEDLGKEIKVKLLWHFLAHNRIIKSKRSQDQLEKLKNETLTLIKKIESNTQWTSCNKKWCDWCNWKKENNIESYETLLIKN